MSFWSLVTSILTWTKQNYRKSFIIIFDELSYAVFRFPLRCSGAGIDGVFASPPPPPTQQVVENPKAQQSVDYPSTYFG